MTKVRKYASIGTVHGEKIIRAGCPKGRFRVSVTLYLVRHGPPPANIREDDPTLIEGNPHVGLAWLCSVSPRVAQALEEFVFEAAYSGDLFRMVETLAGVAAHLPLPGVIYDRRLNVRTTYFRGRLYPGNVEEPFLDHMANMREFLQKIATRHEDRAVFCSTSGGIILVLIALARKLVFSDNACAMRWAMDPQQSADIKTGDVWKVIYHPETGEIEVELFYRLPPL